MGFHWVLVLVPAVAVGVALIAGYVAARPGLFHGFDDLRAQIDADLSMLHLAAEQRDGR